MGHVVLARRPIGTCLTGIAQSVGGVHTGFFLVLKRWSCGGAYGTSLTLPRTRVVFVRAAVHTLLTCEAGPGRVGVTNLALAVEELR